MAVTVVTTSPAAVGSSPGAARSIYVEGNRYLGRFTLACSSTYLTGGFSWDPGLLVGWTQPLAEVKFSLHLLAANIAKGALIPSYDFVNKKIMLVSASTGAELANATDITGLTLDVTLVSE